MMEVKEIALPSHLQYNGKFRALRSIHMSRISEYRSRFNLGSPAQDPANWGSYLRSAESNENSDDFSRFCNLIKSVSKTYSNDIINKRTDIKTAALAGGFNNKIKMVNQYFKEVFAAITAYEARNEVSSLERFDEEEIETHEITKKEHLLCLNDAPLYGSELYDELLEYKLYICQITVEEFERIVTKWHQQINVYCENEYPCIMVQVKDFKKLEEQQQSSFHKILMAYFIGFANKFAKVEKIPFEIVIRASFGHNIPSVAQTSKSFRINIGLVPRAYATKVLAASLRMLNAFVEVVLWKQTFTWGEAELQSINEVIKKHNENRELDEKLCIWTGEESVIEVLSIQIHSLRKENKNDIPYISTIITNQNRYVDLLANYVHATIFDENENDITKPLKKMLLQLTFDKEIYLKVRDSNEYFLKDYEFSEVDPNIRSDEHFWKVIRNIHSAFNLKNINGIEPSKWCYIIERKIIDELQLYLNEVSYLIMHLSSRVDESESESGSECEFSIPDQETSEKQLYYSYKIILKTGMKAINVAAHYAINACNPRRTDPSFMYYETSRAIKNIKNHHTPQDDHHQNVLRFIDLNHCSASGKNSLVNLKRIRDQMKKKLSKDVKEQFIVFDCTSATTKRVREAIQLFAPHVEVLLFVSSGLKNEQLGADLNPYGTLRVISANYNILFKSFIEMKELKEIVTDEQMASVSNHNRRFYKRIGATLTSKGIYDMDGWEYKKKSHTPQAHLEFEK